MNDDLRDKSTDIVPKKEKRNYNSILELLEEVKKKKKMTTMFSSSVKAIKPAR